jgi:hypothetical protein
MNFYAYNFIRLQDSAVSTENMAKSKAQATTSPPPLQPHPKGLTIIVPIQDASLAVTIKKKGIPVAPKMVKHVTALETSPVVANEKKRLQTILDNIHVETGRPYPGNLWEVSEYMPEWMKGEWFSERTPILVMETNSLCTSTDNLRVRFRIFCLAQTRTLNNQRIQLDIPSISGHAMLGFHGQFMRRKR